MKKTTTTTTDNNNNKLHVLSLLSIILLLFLVSNVSAGPYDTNNNHNFLPGRPHEATWDENDFFIDDYGDYDDDDVDVDSDSDEIHGTLTIGIENEMQGKHRLRQKQVSSTSSPWLGGGREFDIFDTRKSKPHGQEREADKDDEDDDNKDYNLNRSNHNNNSNRRRHHHRHVSLVSSSSSSPRVVPTYKHKTNINNSRNSNRPQLMQTVQEWWSGKNWPKIAVRVEPSTTLKIRKTFRPLKTIVRVGADYNTQLGVWQFKSSWEDAIIGGKLAFTGRELQLSKSWQLSFGGVEDLVTRLRFRAAVDLQSWKAYARVGFRTERLTPINVMEGFTLMKRVPLDGNHGNVKLEIKANFALPEPEIEYSTTDDSSTRSLVGMGDIEVNIEELNLLLDY